jgi:hypothetical protein
MESQRINGKPAKAREIGEVVLVMGEEKNRSEWKKGKVLRQVKGKDGVVRGEIRKKAELKRGEKNGEQQLMQEGRSVRWQKVQSKSERFET